MAERHLHRRSEAEAEEHVAPGLVVVRVPREAVVQEVVLVALHLSAERERSAEGSQVDGACHVLAREARLALEAQREHALGDFLAAVVSRGGLCHDVERSRGEGELGVAVLVGAGHLVVYLAPALVDAVHVHPGEPFRLVMHVDVVGAVGLDAEAGVLSGAAAVSAAVVGVLDVVRVHRHGDVERARLPAQVGVDGRDVPRALPARLVRPAEQEQDG